MLGCAAAGATGAGAAGVVGNSSNCAAADHLWYERQIQNVGCNETGLNYWFTTVELQGPQGVVMNQLDQKPEQ
jgi:hypothetical protein